MQTAEERGGGEKRNAHVDENPLEAEILKLRGRWELASVLNFLDVRNPFALKIRCCFVAGYDIVDDYI